MDDEFELQPCWKWNISYIHSVSPPQFCLFPDLGVNVSGEGRENIVVGLVGKMLNVFLLSINCRLFLLFLSLQNNGKAYKKGQNQNKLCVVRWWTLDRPWHTLTSSQDPQNIWTQRDIWKMFLYRNWNSQINDHLVTTEIILLSSRL